MRINNTTTTEMKQYFPFKTSTRAALNQWTDEAGIPNI
jgi:hypothetical protein